MNSQPQIFIKVPLNIAQTYCYSTPERRNQIDLAIIKLVEASIVNERQQSPKQLGNKE
jgi:hypothetical protein